MDQKTASGLPGKTLRAGIIVGVVGAFAVILAHQIMQQAMLRDVYDIDIRIEDIDGNRIGVYFA